MDWLAMLLKIGSKIPVEKLIFRPPDRSAEQEAFFRKIEGEYLKRQPQPLVVKEAEEILEKTRKATSGLSDDEILAYQKREIAKELLLLERHLAQKCKIAGKPCDCCEKHPLAIEALAGETLGITGNGIYQEMVDWAREISPITTEEASRSGLYDQTYLNLSPVARSFRKRLMGTLSLAPLMTPKPVPEETTAQ